MTSQVNAASGAAALAAVVGVAGTCDSNAQQDACRVQLELLAGKVVSVTKDCVQESTTNCPATDTATMKVICCKTADNCNNAGYFIGASSASATTDPKAVVTTPKAMTTTAGAATTGASLGLLGLLMALLLPA